MAVQRNFDTPAGHYWIRYLEPVSDGGGVSHERWTEAVVGELDVHGEMWIAGSSHSLSFEYEVLGAVAPWKPPQAPFRMPLPPPLPGALGEPFARVVDVREVRCAVCSVRCRYESVTSPHPEAPEFLRTDRRWIGFVLEPSSEHLSYLIVCSEGCVQRLLRE